MSETEGEACLPPRQCRHNPNSQRSSIPCQFVNCSHHPAEFVFFVFTILTPLRTAFLFGKPLPVVDGDADNWEPFSSRFTECIGGTMGREGNGGAAARLFSLARPGAREATPIADEVVGACRAAAFRAAVAAIGFGGSDGCVGKDEIVEAAEAPVPDLTPLVDALETPSSWRSFASMRAILVFVLSVTCQIDRYIDGGQGVSVPGAHGRVHTSCFRRWGWS